MANKEARELKSQFLQIDKTFSIDLDLNEK
jgi:hypothetical protein